jgi:ABC exporter DevB family membrane fusion protein
MKRVILLVGIGVVTVAASLWAASNRTPRRTPAAETADTRAPRDVVAAPGRVEAISENIQVGSETTGRLLAVLVDEGDTVAAGQTIARLDDSDARARVQSAEARLRIAEAEYARLVNGARVEERREADAQRLQAEAAVEQAEKELARRSKLLNDGAIAREEFERADRDARMARERRNELTERASVVQADARDDERAKASAAIELAKAQLAEARALLAKTEIRAPRAGVVMLRHRQSGELVSPEAGQSLIVTMADLSRLRVRVEVDETDVARLAVGERVSIRADAYGDQKFEGRVIRIGTTLGRKNIRTDEPVEKTDAKILETLVELDEGVKLPIGLRVDAFIDAPPRPVKR